MSRQQQEWFDSLFQKYSDMVFRCCVVHTNQLQDAQDLYQEVFLKLYEKQPVFSDEAHEKAWLLKVSMNMCRSYHRFYKHHPTISYDEDLCPKENCPHPQIVEVLQTLPPKYKKVLYLHYVEGYRLTEIAKLLHKKDATIRTWLSRGKKLLAQQIEQEDE